MPTAKYIVELTSEERDQWLRLIRGGNPSARTVTWARILLTASEGCSDGQIAQALYTGRVGRTRKRLVEAGLAGALPERPRPGQRSKLTGHSEAHRSAVACRSAPAGRARWTLRLVADQVVGLGLVGRVDLPRDDATRAEKNELQPWQKVPWCLPAVSAELVAAMEDVRDRYAPP